MPRGKAPQAGVLRGRVAVVWRGWTLTSYPISSSFLVTLRVTAPLTVVPSFILDESHHCKILYSLPLRTSTAHFSMYIFSCMLYTCLHRQLNLYTHLQVESHNLLKWTKVFSGYQSSLPPNPVSRHCPPQIVNTSPQSYSSQDLAQTSENPSLFSRSSSSPGVWVHSLKKKKCYHITLMFLNTYRLHWTRSFPKSGYKSYSL